MPHSAVIFDCDGTLVDSETLSISILCDYAREHGSDVDTADAVRRYAGQDLQVVMDELAATLTDPWPADAIDRFRGRQIPALRAKLCPIPGAEALVRSIDVPKCVASNAPQDKIRVCLEATGLDRHFESNRIFSAYDVRRWKPDPTLFLTAAEELGVAPELCVVVEDSRFGVEAGVRAGMRTFAFDPHGRLAGQCPELLGNPLVERVEALEECGRVLGIDG